MINLIKYLWQILKRGLWNVRLDKERPVIAYILRNIRIFTLAGKEFINDKCLTQASALTFFTFFSIVPLAALAFAIAKGFGLQQELEKDILQKNPEYEFVLTNIFKYANAMLDAAKGGVIAGAGVLLLLYSVISLLNNIENTFNQIWEEKSSRNWFRKIADYISIMIFAPIFLILSSSLTIVLQTKLSAFLFSGAAVIGIKLLSFGLMVLVFFFLYKTLTNAFVSIKSAFFGAFFATILFELLQWGYIHFQIGVSRFNAIYGSFAAVPLFLLFVQYSWYIVLFGAEIVYAHQHVDKFELETEISSISQRLKKIFSIMILNKILNHFIEGKKGITLQALSSELDIPNRLAQLIIQDLIDTEFVIEVKQETSDPIYLPLKPDYQISVSELIKALEHKGTNALPMDETSHFIAASKTIEKIEKHIQSHFGDILVKDIEKSHLHKKHFINE
ncbi:MAG: YihY/virulence factor BrkB family protein [Bacteroidia bacterium]|nr:YihY/virulence factor BrkB family protein [Bacteroidia bacterium]